MEIIDNNKTRANDVDHLIAKRLKVRRLMLGLSLREIGKAMDISITQIQKYEQGINRVPSSRLYYLANLLKVPINYFFDRLNYKLWDLKNKEKLPLEFINTFSQLEDPKLKKQIINLVKLIVTNQ